MEQLFFELIRVAIGTQDTISRPPSGNEWADLYTMAKKQSLVGICFSAVQKLTQNQEPKTENLDEVQYLTWMGMAAKIQQKNEVVNRQCVELQANLSADGFRSCILKGQGNIANYGTSGLLRQSGDIDLWVEGGYEKIAAYVQKTAPTKDINQHHANFSVFQDTEVELHFYPLQLNNPLKQKVMNRFCDKVFADELNHTVCITEGINIKASSNAFNLVFQLMHIYHHLFTEGVGLRQLMDYHFVVKREKEVENGSNVQKVKKVISDLGVVRFASALMWVLGEVFGLERDNMLWTPNELDGRFLLNEIMLAGNFGHHDERVPKNMSYWKSFWYLNLYNLRLIRFDYWSWFWTPLSRINGFIWRKRNGFK